MSRMDKTNYYLNLTKNVAYRSTCLRRKFGAIIVKDDVIISTGYNGAPRGRKNCDELGTCFRKENNIPSGQRYELCRSSHAEMNAIVFADHDKMKDATLYLVGVDPDTNQVVNCADSCSICKRLIINAGIKYVIIANSEDEYHITDVQKDWVEHDESLELHEGY